MHFGALIITTKSFRLASISTMCPGLLLHSCWHCLYSSGYHREQLNIGLPICVHVYLAIEKSKWWTAKKLSGLFPRLWIGVYSLMIKVVTYVCSHSLWLITACDFPKNKSRACYMNTHRHEAYIPMLQARCTQQTTYCLQIIISVLYVLHIIYCNTCLHCNTHPRWKCVFLSILSRLHKGKIRCFISERTSTFSS